MGSTGTMVPPVGCGQMSDRIRQYWEERAKQYAENPAATTEDVYLRELEIITLVNVLGETGAAKGGRLLEIGCGDGYSTIQVARAVSPQHLLAVDYSENMITFARQRLSAAPELGGFLEFRVGDVMDLDHVCGASLFDVVLTDRCLINLTSFDNQVGAIRNIAKHIRPAGYYIAIENFLEGHEIMNAARRQMGLPEIPVRWHNCYFREREFLNATQPFFEDICLKDFSSSYYFATRVVYSAMCQMRGETPDYRHMVHQLAVRLPWTGQFSPIRMAVMRRKGADVAEERLNRDE